jgi:hypothetical protein
VPSMHRSHLTAESKREGHGVELLGLDVASPRT